MAFQTKTLFLPARLAWRSQEIGRYLTHYGIAANVASLGFELGKRGLSNQKPVPWDSVFAKNLVSCLISLGPLYIKLGQMLATRPDLVGENVADALRILFDKVPPLPYRKIEKILVTELGKKKFKTAFKSIEKTPLGSASLAQTHRGTLADGTPVILKVQKPGVDATVELDLLLMEGFVQSVHLLYPRLGLKQMFQDFKAASLAEINYLEEAKNIDRFKKNHGGLFSKNDVAIPKYYPDLLTKRVLILEPMRGKKVSDLKKGTTVARDAAELGLAKVLEQIFDHGFFHADPHSGNLFFLEEEGKIGFIDMVLVGSLEPEDKKKFLKVVLAVLKRDRENLSRALFDLGQKDAKADFKKFDKTVQTILDEVKAKGVDGVRFDKLLNALLASSRKNGIHVPNRYVLMLRSILMIEGVAKELNPKISIVPIAIPIVTKSLLKSYNPLRVFRRPK